MALSSPIDCRLYRSHSCVAHFSVSFPHYTTFPSIGTASQVIIDVYEETIREESGLDNLNEAIDQELNWLHDSGMAVEAWDYLDKPIS